jgi:hypothetical protein
MATVATANPIVEMSNIARNRDNPSLRESELELEDEDEESLTEVAIRSAKAARVLSKRMIVIEGIVKDFNPAFLPKKSHNYGKDRHRFSLHAMTKSEKLEVYKKDQRDIVKILTMVYFGNDLNVADNENWVLFPILWVLVLSAVFVLRAINCTGGLDALKQICCKYTAISLFIVIIVRLQVIFTLTTTIPSILFSFYYILLKKHFICNRYYRNYRQLLFRLCTLL